MSEQAQVGDTVRLTITVEGEVEQFGDSQHVQGWDLDHPLGAVEILSRATPPLPSEPGTWWLDRGGVMWEVSKSGKLYCPAYPNLAPECYAPFRQLVLK